MTPFLRYASPSERPSLILVILLVCVTALLAGCRNYILEALNSGVMSSPSSGGSTLTSFGVNLSQEYLALAAFAEQAGKTPGAATRFRAKAAAAARGEKVEPDSLQGRDIPAYARPALEDARVKLNTALDAAMTPENESLLAMAQVKFDCWLLYQPFFKKPGGFIGCREAFEQAMAHVSIPKKPFERQRPAITSRTSYEIAFRDDSAMLTPEAHEMIEQIAAQATGAVPALLVMIGHSKAKVSETDTSNQAVRRTIAVRNALYQYGVDPDAVEVRFERNGDPRVIEIQLIPGGAGRS